MTLNYIGRGTFHDDVAELSGCSKELHRKSFHKLIKYVYSNLKDIYIRYPVNDELEEVLKEYENIGFPGAVGSIDATHVKWFRCPESKYLFIVHIYIIVLLYYIIFNI